MVGTDTQPGVPKLLPLLLPRALPRLLVLQLLYMSTSNLLPGRSVTDKYLYYRYDNDVVGGPLSNNHHSYYSVPPTSTVTTTVTSAMYHYRPGQIYG